MKRLLVFTGSLLLAALAAGIPVRAQDNPNVDNTIGVLPPEAFAPQPPKGPIEVITTADGYDNFNTGVDFAEPHIAMNPNDPLQYFTAFNLNGTHHTEDGYDWASNNPVFPGGSTGDPVTGYDQLGNLFYMNMKSPLTGTWVVKSTDNGMTWGSSVTAVNGIDKCWMVVDQTDGPNANNIYATMTASSGGNFARSTNHGASFTTTFNATSQSLPGMMPAVGADVLAGHDISGGCVYIVTNGGSTTAETFTFYRSTDGGANFSLMSSQFFAGYVGSFVNGRHSVVNSRTRPYPFITADNSFGPYRGRLYCVYASNDPPGNNNKPDIWCRYSDDQAVTWSAPVRINDDANPTLHHQWTPAVWCDLETGRLYAKWYDTRNVPTSDSTDVYASYSDDGGVTWALNQRLTNAKFKINCTSCGGGGVPAYQGDYDHITSNSQGAMAVWTDFRAGNFGSYTSYFPDFAMLVSPANAAGNTTGSFDVAIDVPSVKLFDETASFAAAVSPAGPFSFSFPSGNTLSSYPGSVPMNVSWTNAAEGDYVITVAGTGPNGTPVHRRTINLSLSGGGGVACEDIFFFMARCNSSGAAQAMVKMHGDFSANTLGFDVDGNHYDVSIISNGTNSLGKLIVPHAGMGAHIITLTDPGGCYSTVVVNCVVDAPPSPEWDAAVAEYEYMAEETLKSAQAPIETKIIGNYPNPFNPSTTIRYTLGVDSPVSVRVYNMLGQEVATLVNGYQKAGEQSVVWHGTNNSGQTVASGLYIYRIQAGNTVMTQRMLFMK